jgi:hypothetical protein
MTQVDDLSRSLIAFEQNSTMVVVLEMSQSSWLAAGVVPGIERRPLKKLDPDPTALLRLVEGWRLGQWYRARTEGAAGKRKTTMIVALARKLLIALWRMVTTGEIPAGVALRTAAA